MMMFKVSGRDICWSWFFRLMKSLLEPWFNMRNSIQYATDSPMQLGVIGLLTCSPHCIQRAVECWPHSICRLTPRCQHFPCDPGWQLTLWPLLTIPLSALGQTGAMEESFMLTLLLLCSLLLSSWGAPENMHTVLWDALSLGRPLSWYH